MRREKETPFLQAAIANVDAAIGYLKRDTHTVDKWLHDEIKLCIETVHADECQLFMVYAWLSISCSETLRLGRTRTRLRIFAKHKKLTRDICIYEVNAQTQNGCGMLSFGPQPIRISWRPMEAPPTTRGLRRKLRCGARLTTRRQT